MTDNTNCKSTLRDLQYKLAEVEAMVVMDAKGHDPSPLQIINNSLKQIDTLSTINGLECHDEYNKLRDRYKHAEQVILKGTRSELSQTFFESISMDVEKQRVVMPQSQIVQSMIASNYTTFFVYPRLVKKSNLKIIQLNKLVDILNPVLFHRINRKVIVNLMYVKQIDDSRWITMHCSFNGNPIRHRISKRRFQAFKQKFEALSKLKGPNFPLP